MSYIDEIQAALERVADVTDYRVNLGAGQSTGVGIRDNDVGSVYSPLAFRDSIGGSFLVQWQDGRLSRGNLDGNSLLQWERVIDSARAAAYEDPDAAQFLGPQIVHDLELFSSDVPPLFAERASHLLEIVALLQRIATRNDAKTLNGGVGASVGESWLRTSRGLSLHSRGTSFSYSASFDGIIGDGFGKRTLVPEPEIEAQIERVGNYLQQLRTTAKPSTQSDLTIVLHPNVAYSLFSYYIWNNMGGSSIFHGQSAWRREDFVEQRQVLRPDWTVHVEPWEPLGSGSFGWTGEGLPSAPVTYIDAGRLVSPILDLKYARRLELPIQTPPGNEHSVHFQTSTEQTADALIAEIEHGVLILAILGLHTQDASSGHYSLAAPQALLIEHGEIIGRVKLTLSGNFFAHMLDEELRLIRFPGQHSPGFAYPGAVTFEHI